MPEITIYAAPDGPLTIDYPEWMTEQEALERVLFYLKQKEAQKNAGNQGLFRS